MEAYPGHLRFPAMGDLDVHEVDTPHMVTILQPIWTKKRETASRVRQGWVHPRRREGLGHRKGDNAARWRGHLDSSCRGRAKRKRCSTTGAAWREAPQFMASCASRGPVRQDAGTPDPDVRAPRRRCCSRSRPSSI